MQWPPITMATQHPDNASVPWWRQDAFIPTQDEIAELLTLFRELPIDEYMWDWEGKYVDEAVGEKLFSRAGEYFRKRPLGEDLHLTYRIPAWEDGKTHRSARAFMNVLSLADLAKELDLPRPPVTEMFLPMTTDAAQPIGACRAFRETADYHRMVFHASQADEHKLLELFTVTPLVEDVDSLFNIENIIEPYWQSLRAEGPIPVERGRRVFLARSDPAMNSGLVPAILAVRAALSTLHQLAEQHGHPVYPVLGTGSLPFRGGVRPGNTDAFLRQYAGTSTYSIQSAFRYDYPLQDVRAALQTMRHDVPLGRAPRLTPDERTQLRALSVLFEQSWKPTIEAIAPIINALAEFMPPRRERLLHIGLFGYSRGIGSVKLPRAIVFTAALYSLGIPPELIATGRGLLAAEQAGTLPLLETHYPMLRADLKAAGHFFNAENLAHLAKRHPAFQHITEDIAAIERILGLTLGPQTSDHIIHRNLSSTILHRSLAPDPDTTAITRDIVDAALIRRSLG
jgi:phosphoenolpyruvate carboxylase